MTASVHPQAQQILDAKAASGAPPLWEMTVGEARAGVIQMNELIPAGPDVESVRDLVIASPAGDIQARLYTPSASAPALIVYYHGGGWVLGSVDGWDSSVRALAVASGCEVLSVGCRLAPEHIFPAAADDAYQALTWAAGPAGPAAGRPVVVAGDFTGANLATVSALRARDEGGPAIALQVLVCPVVDADLGRHSYLEYEGNDMILNRRDMAWFWDRYAPDAHTRTSPYASPLRADLSGLPPAYLVTAEHDPLRDEGWAYADRLRDARVPVEHRHYGSQIHAFFTFTGVLDDADKAVSDAANAIRLALEPHDAG